MHSRAELCRRIIQPYSLKKRFLFYDPSNYRLEKIDRKEPQFEKILIANRGEIVCRIIKTCKALGIKTVAVHSDIETNALHVKMADESICLGPAPLKESYLNVDKILKAVIDTKSNAVHPGYGFLSENTNFSQKLVENGVTFIGPNPQAINSMGDKIRSKQIAAKAKVNMIPGYDGEIMDPEHCVRMANELKYPVMIKASAGGGGKGLRIAWNDKEARENFLLAKQEAANSFGDDRMLIEKYIDQARHVEMQVLCDKYGNAIWLNERECSIQRRNQKIFEEAPSCFLDPETRKKMGDQSCALALAVGYDSAGTVEFLVDSKKNFYFLEMNTRLQVEHPITEAISGIDLVYQMIRISYGHKLNISQKDVKIHGASAECRIYAEDPYKSFGLPVTGRITKYSEPPPDHVTGVRCDSGAEEGAEISIFYDPLICKLITHAENRQLALDRMRDALDHMVIRGLSTNIPLLRDIVTGSKVKEGNYSIKYLYETYPQGFNGIQLSVEESKNLAVVAAYIFGYYQKRARNLRNRPSLNVKEHNFSFHVEVPNLDQISSYSVKVKFSGPENLVILADEKLVKIDGKIDFSKIVFNLLIDNSKFVGQLISRDPAGYLSLQYNGSKFRVKIVPEMAQSLNKFMLPKKKVDFKRVVLSPMPGVIKSVDVEKGQMVTEGQQVCVMEAMKMQNSLTSGRSGKIKAINVAPGDTVDVDVVLVELE